MRLTVVTGPANEPYTKAVWQPHLRLDPDGSGDHPDDTIIGTVYLPAARDYLERHTGRRLVSQTLKATISDWPALDEAIDLPVLPVTAVSSVQYYDSTNSLQTFASSNYHLDADDWTARIVLAEGSSWPSVYDRPDAVQITFVAGYSTVPPALGHAVLLMLGHAYENREASLDIGLSETPFGVQSAVATFATRYAV